MLKNEEIKEIVRQRLIECRKEKHLTQYICGLPWNTLSISSYEEFIDKLKFWKDYSNYKQLYTPFDTPLFANSFIYEV